MLEAEARIVREILDLRHDGLKLRPLADRLNGRGVPSPKGGIWRVGTVAYVLDSRRSADRSSTCLPMTRA